MRPLKKKAKIWHTSGTNYLWWHLMNNKLLCSHLQRYISTHPAFAPSGMRQQIPLAPALRQQGDSARCGIWVLHSFCPYTRPSQRSRDTTHRGAAARRTGSFPVCRAASEGVGKHAGLANSCAEFKTSPPSHAGDGSSADTRQKRKRDKGAIQRVS